MTTHNNANCGNKWTVCCCFAFFIVYLAYANWQFDRHLERKEAALVKMQLVSVNSFRKLAGFAAIEAKTFEELAGALSEVTAKMLLGKTNNTNGVEKKNN